MSVANSPASVGVNKFSTTLTRFKLPNQDIQSAHRLVMAGFPELPGDENPRSKWNVLYRIDGDSCIVQSDIFPDWSGLVSAESKRVALSASNGDRFLMRVAVHCIRRNNGKETPTTLPDWLSNRDIGADIEPNETRYFWGRDRSKGRSVPIHYGVLDGIATVTNAELFLANIHRGIGRGKAYGCGLCSIVRLG